MTTTRLTPIDAPRGLAGVIVAETTVSDVRGAEGFYQYRDRSAIELAETASFEDAWQLLVTGQDATDASRPADVAHGGLSDDHAGEAPRRVDRGEACRRHVGSLSFPAVRPGVGRAIAATVSVGT